ncbi:MAG TPA: hypothetical protein VJX74_14655, partial [Blastocatellia bacterium]|nr:hypothetical protein [Blastocatellia bacterium]
PHPLQYTEPVSTFSPHAEHFAISEVLAVSGATMRAGSLVCCAGSPAPSLSRTPHDLQKTHEGLTVAWQVGHAFNSLVTRFRSTSVWPHHLQ